jgi:hypothetical protein
MRGNEARRPILEDQTKEHPMESRVAVLEADVHNIKDNVAMLFDGMKVANGSITTLLTGQAAIRGDIDGLRRELKGDIDSLRAELKGDISTLRADVGTVRAEMGILRAEMGILREEVKGRIEALEARIQRWFVATGCSCAGLAFAAVKLFQ